MPIEHFTKDDFEEFLKIQYQEWSFAGVVSGENCYRVELKEPNNRCGVWIRSSVHGQKSAGTGKDSIRMWIVDENNEWIGKLSLLTNRLPGWRLRLDDNLQQLRNYRLIAGDCPHCNKPLKLLRVTKKNENHGRPFAMCSEHTAQFIWLDVDTNGDTPYFCMDWKPEPLVEEVVEDDAITTSTSAAGEPTPDPVTFSMSSLSSALQLLGEGDVIYDTTKEPMEVTTVGTDIVERVLDPAQSEAVHAPVDQPLRCIAGAGSGKTMVISYRYEYMVKEMGILPIKIVVVTFGNKASGELLDRITARVTIPPMAQQQICTIHAICIRMLKAYYPVYNKYQVASMIDRKKILEKSLARHEPDSDNRPGWEETESWINTCKAYGIHAEDTYEWLTNKCGWDHFYSELLHRVRKDLDEGLRQMNRITYADMLLDAELRLNADDGFLEFCQNRFSYLIVDEGQDTNHQSMRILCRMFDHTNYVTMVGDPDQLLYRFTGATPEANLYEGFEERYPTFKSVMLPRNYRSTKQIVKYGMNVIRNNYRTRGGPYDNKYLKALDTPDGAFNGVPVYLLINDSPLKEAGELARTVVALIKESGKKPDDFYIAARTRAQIGYLEAAFSTLPEEDYVPYVNATGSSFFDLSHVETVLAYMRLVQNGNEKEAFKKVYNIASNQMTVPWKDALDRGKYVHHRFLTTEFLLASEQTLGGMERLLYSHSPRYAWMPGMKDFSAFMYDLKATNQDPEGGPAGLIETILEGCYRKYLAASSGKEDLLGEGSRMDDILTLKELAGQFDNLADFLKFIDRMVKSAKDSAEKEWRGNLVLSTIHKLKGMEREIMIGAGISEGVVPEYGLLPHTFSFIDPPMSGKLPVGGKGRIEDERCLFYVLITRAKKLIILSSVNAYRSKPMQPSRFIAEMVASEDEIDPRDRLDNFPPSGMDKYGSLEE